MWHGVHRWKGLDEPLELNQHFDLVSLRPSILSKKICPLKTRFASGVYKIPKLVKVATLPYNIFLGQMKYCRKGLDKYFYNMGMKPMLPESVKLVGPTRSQEKPTIQTALDRFYTKLLFFFLKPAGSIQPPYRRKSKGICKFKKKGGMQ